MDCIPLLSAIGRNGAVQSIRQRTCPPRQNACNCHHLPIVTDVLAFGLLLDFSLSV
jgi:hypothetical protein